MKVAIIGAGTVGCNVAKDLFQEENDVILIDSNWEALERVQNHLDVNLVHGDAVNPSVLEGAKITDVELVLAVTSEDATNIAVCQLVHAIHDEKGASQPRTIARLRNREYLKSKYFGPNRLLIDTVISPEKLVTDQIMKLIEYPWATQFIEFADGKIQLAAIDVHKGAMMIGHEIRDLRKFMPDVDSRVAAIYRSNESITPSGDTVIEKDDEVFFIAAREHITDIMLALSPEQKLQGKKVVVIGAGKIGVRLVRELLDSNRGYSIHIYEQDTLTADRAASELPESDCIISIGRAEDLEMMDDADFEHTDVFCSVTNSDEANILACTRARELGADRTIALINNTAFADFLDTTDSNIDAVVSPNLVTIGELLKHVRARGRMEAIHSLRGGDAEAIEAIARKTSKVVGRKIAEIELPAGVTVGAILRDNEVLIAHSDIEIIDNDHLVLFLKDKDQKQIAQVEKLFAVGIDYT